ncbi:alpha-ribazole phosphatase family protein [Rhodosalinus sp.]|uniref:alpha-ribazole phosphatase family protein n=1 Tax=Rhodosalinus sp. TaxID=2047741 RepID=UPI00397D6920
MALTLLRHTTPAVAPGTCYGRTDLALADSFEAEAARVIAGLPEVAHVVTSPLGRCLRLAERIAEARGLRAEVAPLWTEMDFGRWEGVPWAELPRDELDAWAADFYGARPHGGESVAELRDRVAAGLARLPAEPVVVVTHMGTIKAALHLAGQTGAWEHTVAFGTAVPVPRGAAVR